MKVVDRRQEAASCSEKRTTVRLMAIREMGLQAIQAVKGGLLRHIVLFSTRKRGMTLTEPGRMMGKLRDSDGRGSLWIAPSCLKSNQLGHGCRQKEVDCQTKLRRQPLEYPGVVNPAGAGVEVGCSGRSGGLGRAWRRDGFRERNRRGSKDKLDILSCNNTSHLLPPPPISISPVAPSSPAAAHPTRPL